MYTLLVGKPPFETDNIKTTYRKIKANDYTIPGSARISEDGRSLIRQLLHRNPKSRPKASEMLDHPFFSAGPFPRALPQSALTMAPSVSALELRSGTKKTGESAKKIGGSTSTRGVLKAINRNPTDIGPKGSKGKPVPQSSAGGPRRESLEALHGTLDGVMQKFAGAKGADAAMPAPEIKRDEINSGLWITKWVDYSNKYGLGYQLSDESVGVLFNDSTKMILNYDGKTVEFVAREKDGGKTTRMTLEDFPAEYKKKITLLKYFNNYMTEHLLRGGGDMVKGRVGGSDGMPYVKKWLRTKHAIVFRLSNNIVQINFFDHTKFILNATGGVATYINKQKVAKTYRLNDLCKSTWRGHGVIMERLAYARDVVGFMRGGKAPKTPSASSEC
jgi:polo-like kinase 1